MRSYILLSILSFSLFSCDNQDPADPATRLPRGDGQAEQPISEPVEPTTKMAAQPEEVQVEEAMTSDMFIAFQHFRKVMLEGSCIELAQQCVFPLEGNCGMYILDPSGDYDAEQTVTKETLLQQCDFLDDNEMAVLKKRTGLESATEVKNDQGVFGDRFSVSEKNNEFNWSVGCYQVLKEEAGEYERIFVFKRIGGKYKLYRIDCAE